MSLSPEAHRIYDSRTGRILTLPSEEGQGAPLCRYLPMGEGLEEVTWPFSFQDYLEQLRSGITSLLLQITRRCNLDCRYCVYSGSYAGMEPHAEEDMPEEILRRSIDFYAERSTQRPEAVIGFYGGEPLLQMHVLKRAVTYAEEKIRDKPIRFQITTNGVLLTRPVLQWLEAHPNVQAEVTLNGPFQDDFRVTAAGTGSLDVIMENLRLARETFPAVWEHQLFFQANLAGAADLAELAAFYREKIGKVPVCVTGIRRTGGSQTILDLLDARPKEQERQAEETLLRSYCSSRDPYLAAWFRDGLEKVRGRRVDRTGRTGWIHGCLPGMPTLYVLADGTIGLCESACDTFRFGDVERGFDLEALELLYQRLQRVYHDTCRHCWAQRLCRICPAMVLQPDGTPEMQEAQCAQMRAAAFRDLNTFCALGGTF